MRHRVTRLSPHQNGKVWGIILAIVSLVFLLPFLLLARAFQPAGTAGAPLWVGLVAPIFYLIFGYIGTAIGCLIYNALIPLTGGIEYDSTESAPH